MPVDVYVGETNLPANSSYNDGAKSVIGTLAGGGISFGYDQSYRRTVKRGKNKMTEREKEDLIDSFECLDELNNNYFEIIKEFSFDKDALLRSRCAALLINFQTDDSLKLLLHLCSDTDDLVRAEAYDSLGAFVFPKVERTLFKSINSEKNTLPLEYAIFSWADVSSKLHNDFQFHISFIKKLLQKNKSEEYAESQIRLACCYALQLFGCNSIYSMIQFLNHEEYLIRCSALNLLYDLLNNENEDLIKSAVLERLNNEETIAVKCEAEKFFQ